MRIGMCFYTRVCVRAQTVGMCSVRVTRSVERHHFYDCAAPPTEPTAASM